MKKKALSLIVALVMVITMLPLTGMADGGNVEDSNVTYTVPGGYIYFDKSSGTITGADGGVTSAVIPASIDGVPVTAIGNSAFSSCHSLTSVAIPAGVTSIDPYAFQYCDVLSSITVDSGNNAYASEDGVLFSKDKSMIVRYPEGKSGAYTIPGTVTAIGEVAFVNCYNLTSVTIPGSVKTIGACAFQQCDGLTSVTIPEGVTSIGELAFYDCYNLETIDIPASVTGVGRYAFGYCDSLAHVYYGGSSAQWSAIDISEGNGCLQNAEFHFTGSVTPQPVTITSLEYADGAVTIEWEASPGAESYRVYRKQTGGSWKTIKQSTTETTFTDSGVTEGETYWYVVRSQIGGVYNDGWSATAQSITPRSSITDVVVNGIHYDLTTGTVTGADDGVTSVVIPMTVEGVDIVEIGRAAFFDSRATLTSVDIPESVTYIYHTAFNSCYNLSSITVSSGNNAYASEDGV
ncbi:MAG: leucine-rich repeat protein, partial [Clostridia bacterium]|nr:leucine-rich repeat protein [Clostridia bacterium]